MKTKISAQGSDAKVEEIALDVMRLRHWQHVMNEEQKKGGLFKIPIHVSFGHEAIAVAVSRGMKSEDQLVLAHRNMAYNIARAGALKPVYEEYLASQQEGAKGRLGSMNLADRRRGIVYTSSILGNNIPVACGLAMAKDVCKEPGIVIVLVGDGSMEEGTFYESLVFAKSHRLKLLIVIENNDHSMSSTIAQRRCPIAVDRLCSAVDIPYRNLSGNDAFIYSDALQAARTEVDELGPACIEVHLKMLNNHAGPTPGWPADTKNISLNNGLLVEAKASDPVHVLREKLDPSLFDKIDRQVRAERWDA